MEKSGILGLSRRAYNDLERTLTEKNHHIKGAGMLTRTFELIANNDARLILRRKLNGATT